MDVQLVPQVEILLRQINLASLGSGLLKKMGVTKRAPNEDPHAKETGEMHRRLCAKKTNNNNSLCGLYRHEKWKYRVMRGGLINSDQLALSPQPILNFHVSA